MAATVATVAYLGLEARAVEVQVQLSVGPAGIHHRRACPTRPSPKAASGCARRWPRSASRCRPSGSPSTCRRPTCPRKARITTCRSRLCLLAAIGATDAETLSHYVAVGELCLDGRIAASPGRAARRDPRVGARQGPDLPGGAGQRGGLGGRARRDRRARPAGAARPSQGHGAGCAARRRSRPSRRAAGPTSPRSRDRKSPSARSRSPRPAGTIC